jgi:hypothetical protein
MADRYGIEHTLLGLSVIPLVAASFPAWLPSRAPA